MPSETDIAPKAICGIGWVGYEISPRDWAENNIGANKHIYDFFQSVIFDHGSQDQLLTFVAKSALRLWAFG